MNDEFKDTLVSQNIKKSRNGSGAMMDVPMRTQRFPVIDGIQCKITLKSKVTGQFMNIGFVAGFENTINGNIADALLNDYPDQFDVIKFNGKRVAEGNKETERSRIKAEVLAELRKDFEIKPKVDDTKRVRTAETQITNNQVPTETQKENAYTKASKQVSTQPIKVEEKLTEEAPKVEAQTGEVPNVEEKSSKVPLKTELTKEEKK